MMISIDDVVERFHEFRAAGTFEPNLLLAYTCHQGRVVGAGTLHWLFRAADRERLRACGSPLSGDWPRIMYRGRVGAGPVSGISWTTSRTVARLFALRPAPADTPREVWTALVEESEVYCHRADLKVEYLVDVSRPRLLESGTDTIVRGFRRDGVDDAAQALSRHWRALAAPTTETRALAMRLGILRDAEGSPIFRHFADLLAPGLQAETGRTQEFAARAGIRLRRD